MAVAYAALVSLTHIIQQIERHPRPPLSLDKQQVGSLTKTLNFLQEFLEGYSSDVGYSEEAQGLEICIAGAAHVAEDLIESHIVKRILADESTNQINSTDFHRLLEDMIRYMTSIEKDAMRIKAKLGARTVSSISAGLLRSHYAEQRISTVGLDDALTEILDKLTRGQPHRQIIQIVGMGGIGKTTLARKVFEHQLIAHYFNIFAWVTISQEYSMRSVLEFLCVKTMRTDDRGSLNGMSVAELGEKLYKSLSGERYLIVMDDIWDAQVWDLLQSFFPNNRNGSRIMITTRLSNLAFLQSNSYKLEVKFLDEEASWDLLCRNVFGERSCPLELVEIGKRIARNCSGLPLSIVVIGGLLAKSGPTRVYWEYISKHLISIVNSQDDERCLKILHLSYMQLPVHLKPCFLYMGVFPEDRTIRVSRLIKLLVGEGFLKPTSGRSHEEVAEDYVKDLVDRNLILVSSYCYDGKVKVCKMHDLLRDLCLKQVEKEKLFCSLTEQSLGIPQDMNSERRIVINKRKAEEEHFPDQVFHALGSARFARSLIWDFQEPLPSFNLRLLRVFSIVDESFPEAMFQQVNLRYLSLDLTGNELYLLPVRIPSSISLLWNLQTLIVGGINAIVPCEIWKMPLIKHVIFSKAELRDPPTDDDIVLENLETLVKIHNFKCSEEVVKRIPSIKNLKIYYEHFAVGPRSCISSLARLHKLESLGMVIDPFPDVEETRRHLVQNLTFPHSLKKLTIGHTRLHWEDLNIKIGSLPLLEVLKLKWQSFVGPKWETVQGKFRSLKFLLVEFCDLEHWMTENTHFPRLEHVVLRDLPLLKEIDPSIGDIPTLGTIELEFCTISAVVSAKTLLEEQEELGNDGLRVRVLLLRKNKVVESLASPNFQVKT